MPVLFGRVGFMKYYEGPQPGDARPIGGGAYNKREVGGEAWNFHEIDGYVYGYFQPPMRTPETINLERIDPHLKGNRIPGVLVVMFATHPVERGQVVIGWYKNATVYRSPQSLGGRTNRSNVHFYVKAKAKDATLLPISKRRFPVGHRIKGTKKGNPGESNVFYALTARGKKKDTAVTENAWIPQVAAYVSGYKGPRLVSSRDKLEEEAITANQGFQSDVEIRMRVERYAMDHCKAHYIKRGFDVEDKSATESYDLLVRKGRIRKFVEVKGTQSEGRSIVLTKNEVDFSRANQRHMVLYVVHSIKLNKKSIKKGSGVVNIVEPWSPSVRKLRPISFFYTLS